MSDAPATPTPPADDLLARLGSVRPMTHQEDERPNREQLEAGQHHPVSPGPPVPLPRWLSGGKKKPKRGR
jgi:hypothetical protein